MSEPERVTRLEIRLYIERAQQMLGVAALSLIELPMEAGVAEKDLGDARRFVERAEQYLRQEGWL
jgi:hypothetical protein